MTTTPFRYFIKISILAVAIYTLIYFVWQVTAPVPMLAQGEFEPRGLVQLSSYALSVFNMINLLLLIGVFFSLINSHSMRSRVRQQGRRWQRIIPPGNFFNGLVGGALASFIFVALQEHIGTDNAQSYFVIVAVILVMTYNFTRIHECRLILKDVTNAKLQKWEAANHNEPSDADIRAEEELLNSEYFNEIFSSNAPSLDDLDPLGPPSSFV